jgi:hypothetical protein
MFTVKRERLLVPDSFKKRLDNSLKLIAMEDEANRSRFKIGQNTYTYKEGGIFREIKEMYLSASSGRLK